jgi:hypothetical protein
MSDVVKLKPCPFCRGVAKLEDHRLLWAVRCESCTACVLGERAPEPQTAAEAEATDWTRYKQTAIDAWNNRVDTSIPCTHPPGCTSCSWCGFKATIGHNPVKDLKSDADGYYTVDLGQLGTFNGNGTVYRPETVKKAFIDRINRGPMYVEYGRPRVDSLNDCERHSRLSIMDERRFCGVIVTGGLETRGEAEHLTGRFKPMGPLGSIVRDMLCTEDETLHFGLRGFTNPNDRSDLRSITTWDLIAPPQSASKEQPKPVETPIKTDGVKA